MSYHSANGHTGDRTNTIRPRVERVTRTRQLARWPESRQRDTAATILTAFVVSVLLAMAVAFAIIRMGWIPGDDRQRVDVQQSEAQP